METVKSIKEKDINEIVLYSTGCPKCKILKSKLSHKSIGFKEINDTDKMLKKGIAKVPVLEINGKIMSFVEANSWVNDQ